MAFITHIRYEAKPFNLKMTPYTPEGRMIYANTEIKINRFLKIDRQSTRTVWSRGKGRDNIKTFGNCL